MRTFTTLLFIAGVAALAIGLARRPTIADRRVLADEILALYAGGAVTAVVCDDDVRLGTSGASFACTVTIKGGATQRVACTLDRDGHLAARPAAPPRPAGAAPEPHAPPAAPAPPVDDKNQPAIPPSRDPWAN